MGTVKNQHPKSDRQTIDGREWVGIGWLSHENSYAQINWIAYGPWAESKGGPWAELKGGPWAESKGGPWAESKGWGKYPVVRWLV